MVSCQRNFIILVFDCLLSTGSYLTIKNKYHGLMNILRLRGFNLPEHLKLPNSQSSKKRISSYRFIFFIPIKSNSLVSFFRPFLFPPPPHLLKGVAQCEHSSFKAIFSIMLTQPMSSDPSYIWCLLVKVQHHLFGPTCIDIRAADVNSWSRNGYL